MTKPFSIETLRSKPEGQTFDRKSARIDAKALAVVLTAMANADYGFVREFGEGINRIYEKMLKAGLPAPEFKQSDFILRATIRKIVNTEKKSDGQSVVADRIDENVSQNVAQNDRRSAIIKCIKENPYISRAKIAYILGVSVKTVERDIAEMSDMISYIGSAKNGYWQINDNNDTKTENL